VDTKPEPFDSLLDQQVKAIPINIVEEDVLPGIPTQDYVITCTGIMDTGFTCHVLHIFDFDLRVFKLLVAIQS